MMRKQDVKKLVEAYETKDANRVMTLLFLENYENFWSSSNQVGHVTASCWVVNENRDKALLTHHKKLNRWFQLGGHIEADDATIYEACQRELKEESGLTQVKLLRQEIFDIDVHKIPTKRDIPEHFHFDIRLLFEADEDEKIAFDPNESKAVQWVSLDEILQFSKEESVLRMVRKMESL